MNYELRIKDFEIRNLDFFSTIVENKSKKRVGKGEIKITKFKIDALLSS